MLPVFLISTRKKNLKKNRKKKDRRSPKHLRTAKLSKKTDMEKTQLMEEKLMLFLQICDKCSHIILY